MLIKGTGTESSRAVHRCVLEGPREGVLVILHGWKGPRTLGERLSEALVDKKVPGRGGHGANHEAPDSPAKSGIHHCPPRLGWSQRSAGAQQPASLPGACPLS